MGSLSPRSPARADHRIIKFILTSVMGGKVESVPTEFDLIGRVFVKAGGSWEQVFAGSPQDLELLKRVIKRAIKLGYLTKKYNWSGKKPEKEVAASCRRGWTVNSADR